MLFMILFLTLFKTDPAEAIESSLKSKELAAMRTQDQSIKKLQTFISSHPGDLREGEFLNRLADLYLEKSGISFQYTEGESTRTSKQHYQNSLIKAVNALTQLITKHPRNERIAEAYFKRAKAFKELHQKPSARNDFIDLVQKYPDFPRIDTALIDLATFAQDDNHHEEALMHLNILKKIEDSPYLSIGYRKSAWSHFNLGNYQAAINDIEKEIHLYPNDGKELHEVESAYTDLALFIFESINKKTELGTIDQANKTIEAICSIRSSAKNNSCHGISFLKLAKLLKAYQLGNSLEALKESLIRKHILLPETLQITLLLNQFWFERHEYGKLAGIIEEAINVQNEQKLNQSDLIIRTIKQSIAELHELVLKNRKSTEIEKLIIPLDSLTQLLCRELRSNTPERAEYIFSMAETAFAIKNHTLANQYYEKLLNEDQKLPEKLKRNEIKRRLISSQYQELKSIKPALVEFEIKKIGESLISIKKENKLLIEKWVTDTLALLNDKSNETEAFQLEALKLMYLYLDRSSATEKMVKISFRSETDEIRKNMASIAFDTYSISNKIDQLIEPCQSGTWLKITKIAEPCTLIIAKASILENKLKKAESILKSIKPNHSNQETLKTVSLLNAEIHRKQGELRQSIDDQETYLELTGWKDSEMAKTVFQYHWLHKNLNKYSEMMVSPRIKSALTDSYLDQYRAAMILETSIKEKLKNNTEYQKRFKASIKSQKNTASLWALSCLNNSKKLPYQDRMVLLQRTANNWEYLDPYLQIRYLALMQSRLGETIESLRKDARSIAPIRTDMQSVEKRMTLLREIDLAFSKAMNLDWFEIKFKTMNELQLVFQDLIRELNQINAGADAIRPFKTKQEEITKGIEQLISLNSKAIHPIIENALLEPETLKHIPDELRSEWTRATQKKEADLLHYLISIRKHDQQSDALRGLVLITLLHDSAKVEGFQLIKDKFAMGTTK